MQSAVTTHDVLLFWFKELSPRERFLKSDALDNRISKRFQAAVHDALTGKMDHWRETRPGSLAWIVLLDQLTRNIYRNTPRAFVGDLLALSLSLECVKRDYLDAGDPEENQFMLMPLMHSEDLHVQKFSLPLFKAYTSERVYDYAVRHHNIIAQFGRFPHRNASYVYSSAPWLESLR